MGHSWDSNNGIWTIFLIFSLRNEKFLILYLRNNWVFFYLVSHQCPITTKKAMVINHNLLFYLVGLAGLEPATKGL